MNALAIAEFHQRFAREFVTLADFAVPSFYKSPVEEFAAASHGPVVIDRSFLGKARVFGRDASSLLHRLTTNETRHLNVGQRLVNIFTNSKGRIIDVVEMLRREEDYLLITSPGRAPTVLQWIDKYTFIEDVHGEDLTAAYALFSIFGRISPHLAGLPLDDILPQHFRAVHIAGADALLQRTDGVAPEGYNLIVKAEEAVPVWEVLCRHAQPIGFAAYTSLRVHAGIPAVDAEISEQQNPHEVNLLPFVNFDKGCYLGQEVVARLDTYDKVQRRLVGLDFENDKVPPLTRSLWAGDDEAGVLTSAVFSPRRHRVIGLGLVRRKFAEDGQRFVLRSGDDSFSCSVVALPFAET